jgi:hypothetical protein
MHLNCSMMYSHQDRTVHVVAEACKVGRKFLLSCVISSTILMLHFYHSVIISFVFVTDPLCIWTPYPFSPHSQYYVHTVPSHFYYCYLLISSWGCILLKLPPLQQGPFLSAYSGPLASAGIPTWVSLRGTCVMNVEWTLVADLTSRGVQTMYTLVVPRSRRKCYWYSSSRMVWRFRLHLLPLNGSFDAIDYKLSEAG